MRRADGGGRGQAARTLKTFRQFDELFSSDAHTAFMTTPYWLLGRGSRMGGQPSAHTQKEEGWVFPLLPCSPPTYKS